MGHDRGDETEIMNALTMNALIAPRPAARGRTSTHPGLLERAFSVVVLFLSTGGLLPVLRLEGGVAIDDLEGDAVMQIIWLVVYGVTLVLLATRAKATLQLLIRERWLILLCGLAAASVIWSGAPGVTFRRTAALFGTTAFGVYLASRYTVAEVLRLLCWVLGAAAVLSVALVILFPTYGISDDDAGWRGIFVHKNALGRAMALAIQVLLFQFRHRGVANRVASVAMLAVACLALLGSNSVAGMLTAVAAVVTLPLWPILRLQRTLAVASAVFVVMAVIIACGWIGTAPDVMVSAVGKDPSLTGRAGLWAEALDVIKVRPLLGHGYNAFWLGWEGESASIWSALSWKPAHSHNGFLDLGLELGVVGLVLFIVGFAMAVGRATVVIRMTSTSYGLWPIAYLLFIVMINLAESTIMVRNSMFWVLYVVTCMWLIRPRSDERTARG
jgi:O-antigen ligase